MVDHFDWYLVVGPLDFGHAIGPICLFGRFDHFDHLDRLTTSTPVSPVQAVMRVVSYMDVLKEVIYIYIYIYSE